MPEILSPTEWDEMIENQQWESLRGKLAAMLVSDIAEMLTTLPHKHEAVVFRLLSREDAARVFAYLPLDRQEELVHSLSSVEVKNILDRWPLTIARTCSGSFPPK